MKKLLFAVLAFGMVAGLQPSFAASDDGDDDSSYSGCPFGDHDKKKETATTS